MSSLSDYNVRPAQHVENGHNTALRSGRSFSFHAEIPSLAPAAIAVIRFTTGDSPIVFENAIFNINQEEVTVEVYEDSTFTVAGTPNADYVLYNNRLKPAVTELAFYDGATVDAIGVRAMHDTIYGIAGQNVNQPGFGASTEESTIVLKPNTEHIFRITNNSVLAVAVESHVFYREADPREFE